ncbi:NS3 [Eubenangee virus]|uniref:NS3 n=1 Tax=Eubenangee virus TaxID=40056 RepID=H9ZXS1_9REOV|nr:NS3 [Eubenangee virus]AFH41518.1 NS3 [Eubenangee virus]
MLSELAARFEAEKQHSYHVDEEKIEMESGEDRSLVKYVTPPSYVPIYPTAPAVQPAGELSLNILNNAMTNSTGATNALKEEKTAYGAYAEALRDNPAVQNIKMRVYSNTIPRLENELRGKKRKRMLVHTAMLASAGVAAVTSVSSLIKDINVVLPASGKNETTAVTIPSWFASFSTVFNLVNLLATGAMMGCARAERGLDSQIAMLRKEITKKKSYNDAVRMSVRDDSDVAELIKRCEGAAR